MPKPLSYRETWKRLRAHSSGFQEHVRKGRGSHRMICHHNINGQKVSCPIPCHGGRDISKGILRSIIRAFDLPKDIFD